MITVRERSSQGGASPNHFSPAKRAGHVSTATGQQAARTSRGTPAVLLYLNSIKKTTPEKLYFGHRFAVVSQGRPALPLHGGPVVPRLLLCYVAYLFPTCQPAGPTSSCPCRRPPELSALAPRHGHGGLRQPIAGCLAACCDSVQLPYPKVLSSESSCLPPFHHAQPSGELVVREAAGKDRSAYHAILPHAIRPHDHHDCATDGLHRRRGFLRNPGPWKEPLHAIIKGHTRPPIFGCLSRGPPRDEEVSCQQTSPHAHGRQPGRRAWR